MAGLVHIKRLCGQKQSKVATKAHTQHRSRTYLIAHVHGQLCATSMSIHCKQHSSVYLKKHTLRSPAAQSNKHELQAMWHEHGACIKIQNCRGCSSCSRLSACSSTCDPCLHQSSSKPRYELHDISRSSRPSGLLPCFSFFFPAILVCFFSSAKDTTIIPYATP